jgi:hypothetical protein
LATGWLSLAKLLLTVDRDIEEYLGFFHDSFQSGSSVGESAAASMEICLPLLEQLVEHPKLVVAAWAEAELKLLAQEIEKERERDGTFWSSEEAEPRFE